MIETIKQQALHDNVPIMSDDALAYVCQLIEVHRFYDILEFGTAVGYSSLLIAQQCPWVMIDTIEKDPIRYHKACEYKAMLKNENVIMHQHDAKTWPIIKFYDVVIIDAAKAQNQALFERVFPFVKHRGVVIVDNMSFYGHVHAISAIKHRRNLRQMVEKINKFHLWLQSQNHLETMFVDVGDGLMIIKRK
jgi:predicted O-methyltransferase YrrM